MASLSNDAAALIPPACPHAFVRFTGFDAEKVPIPLPNTDDLEPKMGALPDFSLLSLANNVNGVIQNQMTYLLQSHWKIRLNQTKEA